MRCPFCGSDDTQVKDSRPADDGSIIRRRRLCAACAARFTTVEHVQLRQMNVIKKNGAKQLYNRGKLKQSLHIALQKRPVESEKLERIVNSITRQIESTGENEVSSEQIGKIVMDALREIDNVGYVRFASVYHNFKAVDDFAAFITGPLGIDEDAAQDDTKHQADAKEEEN